MLTSWRSAGPASGTVPGRAISWMLASADLREMTHFTIIGDPGPGVNAFGKAGRLATFPCSVLNRTRGPKGANPRRNFVACGMSPNS